MFWVPLFARTFANTAGSEYADAALPANIVFVEIFGAPSRRDQFTGGVLISDWPFSRHAHVRIHVAGRLFANFACVVEHQISADVMIRLAKRPGHGRPRGRESTDANALWRARNPAGCRP